MADNQYNYQNNQIYQIDINKIYSDVIQEIDSIRSYVNTTNPNNVSSLLESLKSTSSKIHNIKTETDKQESRCHAFYRMIGFPVVNANYEIYNPGHDIHFDSILKLDDKINIALNPISGFKKISFERETYNLKMLDIFANSNSIDAGVLSITSGSSGLKSINLRKFSSPFKNDNAFDMKASEQSYTFELLSMVGKNEIFLFNYQDVNGFFTSKLNKTKNHIIKPFIVDPIIDFSVNPNHNRVSVPFPKNQLYTKVSFNKFAKRPIIEKVIRDRFSLDTNIKDAGTASETIVNYVKNIPAIKDENIIKRISSNSNIYKISEQAQFTSYLNIIREMMVKLVDSLRIIHKTQTLYYWVPRPSKIGPEGGCEVRNVFIPTNIDSELITEKDNNILNKIIQSNLNQFNTQTIKNNGTADTGGFLNDFFQSFSSETTSALGDSTQNTLDSLIIQRKKILDKANEALKTVEIIMGEFSGLGLCDIIAILGALYLMPKDKLTGFLDIDAYNRMTEIPEFKKIPKADYQDAMNSFALTVKDFYNLMDKIYEDLIRNKGLLA